MKVIIYFAYLKYDNTFNDKFTFKYIQLVTVIQAMHNFIMQLNIK